MASASVTRALDPSIIANHQTHTDPKNPLPKTSNIELTGLTPSSTTQLALDKDTTVTTTTATPTATTLIVASPYTEPDHLLELQTLEPSSQFLARALTHLNPTRLDYATAPYTESFNWDAVFTTLHELSRADGYTWVPTSFYVVVFQSILSADADLDLLHALDFEAHREAVESGGLLKYWFGTRNAKRENLATCVWRSREDARLGGLGPWHKRAREAARGLYERIEFTTLELLVGGTAGEWEFRGWVDQN